MRYQSILSGDFLTFSKWIVSDLESRDFFVLVCRHSDELGAGKVEDVLFLRRGNFSSSADTNDVNSRLVFVQRVEHDLTVAGRLVGQLHFREVDGFFGPVIAVVGRIRVLVDWIVRSGFGFTALKKKGIRYQKQLNN